MDSGRNKRIQTTDTHLPDEIWSLIYEKLISKEHRDSFGLTCHKFLDIQSSSRKELTHDCQFLMSNPDTDSFVHNMLNRFRQLELLSLDRCWGLSGSGLTPLQMYGSKLQSLNLTKCTRLTDNGLSYVASGCPLLSVVSLRACRLITDYGLQILTESCKSLKQVDLSFCSELTDNGIRSLNQNCRQLTKLWISGCHKILGKGFQGVSPTLAVLEAENCRFNSKGVSSVLSGGGLEYLNLSSRYKDSREFDLTAIGLGFGAHIKFLYLKNRSFVEDATFFFEPEDATITKIAKGCPLLEEWNLSGCYSIGWESIARYCHNLEILHMNGCGSERRLKALAEGCARLSEIYWTPEDEFAVHPIPEIKIYRDEDIIRVVQIRNVESREKSQLGALPFTTNTGLGGRRGGSRCHPKLWTYSAIELLA